MKQADPGTKTLTDAEIRPDHLKEGQMKAFLEDIRNLVSQKDRFVAVPCPACGSERNHHVFDKYGMQFTECDACGTVYINPRPTPEILEQYYATSKNYWYWNNYIFPSSENVRREKIFRPRVERVRDICTKYHVPMDTLLEVGAGFGTFCEELKKTKSFRKIIAVEPTPDLAETCRKRGLEVIQLPIEKVQLDKDSVNVIVSFEVIEHLFNPGQFIRRCGSLLPKGGILVLSCPNFRGFDITVMREKSDSIDVEHLNYFTPSSLSQLLGNNGFRILEISTPGKLDADMVRKKALNHEFDLTSNPFLKQVLLDEWEKHGSAFQEFLAQQGLSSHLWIVGQKE